MNLRKDHYSEDINPLCLANGCPVYWTEISRNGCRKLRRMISKVLLGLALLVLAIGSSLVNLKAGT